MGGLLQREALMERLEAPGLDDRLVVTPLLDANQVGPGSIDLRLGTEFIEVRRRVQRAIDPFHEDVEDLRRREELVEVEYGDFFVLHPGHFVLGATMEFLRMPADLAGQVLGRSSWGRLGLLVATAVQVQPGFAGCLTLELVNIGTVPILLYPGLRVAQLVVWDTVAKTATPYREGDAKYQIPLGPQSSRIGWESAELLKLENVGRRLRNE